MLFQHTISEYVCSFIVEEINVINVHLLQMGGMCPGAGLKTDI
jgi:hypothetical protein